MAGAEELRIPVASITEVAAGGIHHNLDISAGEQTIRFSGRGAIRVHSRLMALLSEGEELPEGEEPMFEPGEQVFLQGQAELYVNDLIAVRGEITLTNCRFRFVPGLGLARILWRNAQIDVALTEVSDWELQNLRRMFSCLIGGKTIRVGGALAADLYLQLQATVQEGDPSEEPSWNGVLETWKVSFRRGLVSHPGDLSVSAKSLQFQPTGLLDSVMGVKPFDVQLEDITSLSIQGWTEKRLLIRAGHHSYSLLQSEQESRYEALIDLVRDRHYRRIQHIARGDNSAYLPCLDSWSERIRYDDSEQIIVSTVAVSLSGRTKVLFGWLLLTRSRLLFLPIGGPASQESHLDLPLADISRLDGGPRTPEDQIFLSANDISYRFMLAQREGLTEEFWAQCRSPTRVLPWSTLGPRALSRISGEARFIRILSHGEVVVDLSPGVTVPHADGVALLLPGEPGSSLPLEQWITVEIGQTEAVYQLDSQIVRSAPVPLEMPIADPDNYHLLIVSFPEELRVYNQRESYRVPTQMHLRAHVQAQTADAGSWMATGEAFECDLIDLSIGGALVNSVHPIQKDDRVTLNLPLMDQWVEIRATCVRAGEPDSERPGCEYGMEFRELTTTQEDAIHKAIIQLQRDALADDEAEALGVED